MTACNKASAEKPVLVRSECVKCSSGGKIFVDSVSTNEYQSGNRGVDVPAPIQSYQPSLSTVLIRIGGTVSNEKPCLGILYSNLLVLEKDYLLRENF